MIAALLGFFFYADSKGVNEADTVKWMNIFITAAFVFGYTVNFFVLQRLHWEKASYFWLILVIGIPEMATVFFLMGLMFQPKVNLPSEYSPK
jgi:hypothetical protein